MAWIQTNWKGLLLSLVIAIPAYYLGTLLPVVGGPVFAILIGMVVTLFVKNKKSVQTGVNFTSKKILQWAVILLGFGMDLAEVLLTGGRSLPIIISTIATALILAFIMHKVLRMQSRISTLIGVGSSICGGSAIAATAPVISATDEEIAQSISVIFLFNVIAALIFPSMGQMLGLTNEGFALFAGTAVNDTSSVTAAATAWDGMHGSDTLTQATIVKMTRTLAIIPITLVLALMRTAREKKKDSRSGVKVSIKQIFPFFVLWFILASVVTTIFHLPAEVTTPLKTLSKFFIVMAMAAIGFNTDIVKLFKTGGKPILMGLVCWIGISIVSLTMQRVLGLW